MAGPYGERVDVPVPRRSGNPTWKRWSTASRRAGTLRLARIHRDGKYYLEDGNHRYETLRRNGAAHAWTILLFADDAERDQYLEQHSRVGKRPCRDDAPPERTGASDPTT